MKKRWNSEKTISKTKTMKTKAIILACVASIFVVALIAFFYGHQIVQAIAEPFQFASEAVADNTPQDVKDFAQANFDENNSSDSNAKVDVTFAWDTEKGSVTLDGGQTTTMSIEEGTQYGTYDNYVVFGTGKNVMWAQANPNAGNYFTGWTVTGGEATGTVTSGLTFTAGFGQTSSDFCITALENGETKINLTWAELSEPEFPINMPNLTNFKYSYDGQTNWTSVTKTENGYSLPVLKRGQSIYLKDAYASVDENEYSLGNCQYYSWVFDSNKKYATHGNLTNFLKADFNAETDSLSSLCFAHLFDETVIDGKQFSNLTLAPNLPAIHIGYGAYAYLFKGCKFIENAPDLSSAVLVEEINGEKVSHDCAFMYAFENCKSLKQLPSLPAETLSAACYLGMFKGCSSIQNIEGSEYALPAMTLAESCYECMFEDCTSMILPPSLPATTFEYTDENDETTTADCCYRGMFMGCTKLYVAPKLPAASSTPIYNEDETKITGYKQEEGLDLAVGCYQSMFENCKQLEATPELTTIRLKESCYESMFKGCSKLSIASELRAGYYNPETWPPTYGNLDQYCYKSMFEDCTSLIISPTIHASDDVSDKTQAFAYMFKGCSNLRYIDIYISQFPWVNDDPEPSEDYPFYNWVEDVPTWAGDVPGVFMWSGTFDQSEVRRGISFVPEEWVLTTHISPYANTQDFNEEGENYEG